MTKTKTKIPHMHRKQIKALDRAIKVLIDWRRRHYGPGHWAYERGDRGMTFIEDGHRHYLDITQDIQQLEDLKEIILEPGDQYQLFVGEQL